MSPPVVLPPSAGVDVTGHLAALLAGPFRHCELRSDPADTGWVEALAATRWRDAGVRERWAGPLPRRPVVAGFVPLRETGWAAFTERLTAVLSGVPERFGADGAALIDTWKPMEPGEDALWGLVGDFGIVAPRCIEPGVGALLFVGVLPDRRGEGLGRRTFDAALAELHRTGATHYEDEVDATNLAMRHLFQDAGLRLRTHWRSWVHSEGAP